MAISVSISNLKSIKKLEFEVPLSGAYVLTGANGCGKTSLLVALHRMGAPNAFQTGLPGARQSNGIDGLEDASISYDIHGNSVSYRYNATRWSATPKANSSLVTKAFTEVHFLKADSSRVEPTPNELKGARKVLASPDLIKFLNQVFDTKKFDNLHRINLPGRKTVAHLVELPVSGGKRKTYYSEKNFSLGELCVMRLAQKLLAARTGSLYIIDEFEMALHPAAQIRLFNEIEKLAGKTNYTALVSTHSSSLIKSVKRSNIIYLENNAGAVSVYRNVYPTFALQHLALDEENSPDRLIFVEDVSAKHCVDAMWLQYLAKLGNNQSAPTMQSVVIGGYKEVLRFLDRSPAFVSSLTNCVAALDADAEPICVPPAAVTGKITPSLTVPQGLYQKLKSQVSFLPWTPEVGFCELLRNDLPTHVKGLQAFTGVVNLKITISQVSQHVGLSGKASRDKCKQATDEIAEFISTKKSWSAERANEALFEYLIKVSVNKDKAIMAALTGRLFN